MFDILRKFLDAVVTHRKCSTISVSSDEAKNMTGNNSGSATHMQTNREPGLIRFLCGFYQLDLITQEVYSFAPDEQFFSTLTGLIQHLHRQENLIKEM